MKVTEGGLVIVSSAVLAAVEPRATVVSATAVSSPVVASTVAVSPLAKK